MRIHFYKMEGTGNDFIVINNCTEVINNGDTFRRRLLTPKNIRLLCDRKTGIGADGLLLLNPPLDKTGEYDFEMVYYNADGNLSTFCANGARCVSFLTNFLEQVSEKVTFLAHDGLHRAEIRKNNMVKLQMQDVPYIRLLKKNEYFLDTGSPHFVRFINSDIRKYPVFSEGRRIRNHPPGIPREKRKKGINVNFVKALTGNNIFVRTYERGVENETLSCGTGVTASALAFFTFRHPSRKKGELSVSVFTPGGKLNVHALYDGKVFKKVFLAGPVSIIYEGYITI